MRRSNRVKWSELKVGIVVMFAFGMMMWASFFGGGTSIFERKSLFVAYFDDVNGLTTGSPVWMQGVEVGNVRSIRFDNQTRKIEVVGRVMSSAWPMVTTDSKVKIGAIGLIGDKYLQLHPGKSESPQLEDGGTLETIEDDVDKIFREGASALENMNALTADFKKLLDKINSGEGLLGKLINDPSLYYRLDSAVGELTTTLAILNDNQQRVFDNLDSGARSFAKIAEAFTDTTGTIGKLLSDSSLYVDLRQATTSLAEIFTSIDSGRGTLGALVRDEELYDNAKDLLSRIENLLLDMESNPKKYFKVSVF